MSARSVRFLTAELTTDVDETELAVLRDELEKIGDTTLRRSAVDSLLGALDRHLGRLETAAIFEPNRTERALLLRATDHLRELGHRGELMTLRSRIAGSGGVEGISYRLSFTNAQPDQQFVSYSLAYRLEDRLVTAVGEQLRVIGVEASDPDELWVAPWRPTERVD
jgi:hypothetical protein